MDVFISYRRQGGSDFCGRLYDRLISEHYSAFYDRESLTTGKFNEQIYGKIARCNNFVLILPKGGLDRCVNADDWVRKEIKKALDLNKNVIPVFLKGFEFPAELPGDIDAVRDFQGIWYDSASASFDYFYNLLTSYFLDENGGSLLARRKQKDSNMYYEVYGMSQREKDRIKADRQTCCEVEDKIFADLLKDRENFVIFNPAVYEPSVVMDLYKPFPYAKVLGFVCNQKEADEANELYADRRVCFRPGDLEDDDFEENMDGILRDNNLKGFDFVDLTLILKDSKNPAKKLNAIVERLNDGAIIYVRELDDGIVVFSPDPQGLFQKLMGLFRYDKYSGARNFGRQVYNLLKNLDAEEVKMVNSVITTANMKMKRRKLLFDTYFSYLEPEFDTLISEDPENEIYKEKRQWLAENYEKLEQAFLAKDFFFMAGFMFFYARFGEMD